MKPLVERQVAFGGGMNDSAAATEYQPNEVSLLLNGRVSYRGNALERRSGSKRMHAAALASGTQGYGGTQFITAAGAVQLIAFVGAKMFSSADSGVTWVERATGLTQAYWTLVQMRVGAVNYLICANGSTNIYTWDGTTWSTLANAPTGAKYVAVFNDRLYAAGHSGSTVAASKVGDPATWASPDGLIVQVTTHDGDSEITGLYQIGTVLLAFKRDSTNYLEGFGFQTLEVEAGSRGVSRSVGCIAPRSIAGAGDQGLCWLSERGFEYWTPGGAITLISRPVQSFMDTVAWATIKNAVRMPVAMYWPQQNEYWCALSVGGGTNDYTFRWRPPTEFTPQNIALDIYTQTGALSVFRDTTGDLSLQGDLSQSQVKVVSGNLEIVETGGTYVALTNGDLALAVAAFNHAALFTADLDASNVISGPCSVGYDGFVRRMEIGDTDDATAAADDGQEILLTVRGKPFYFEDPIRRKRARTVRVVSQQFADADLTVTVYADGEPQRAKSMTAEATPGGRPQSMKSRVNGRGNTLQITVSTSGAVKISALEMIAEPLMEAL